MDIKTIFEGAERLITQLIRQESTKQGHYLSGRMEDSIGMEVKRQGQADVMEGFAAYYTTYVEHGVPAKSASMKQFPFVMRYFIQRGLAEKEAKAAAAATIRAWQREGMSTERSKRFSETGARQHFIESALVGGQDKVDDYLNLSFDHSMDEEFNKEKSETI